jgi:hypothetical protein
VLARTVVDGSELVSCGLRDGFAGVPAMTTIADAGLSRGLVGLS